ncbi:hypothetical protein TNCV_2751781 [Trichonephila clavipes]|nr:hypothetical protein TNCV_2751781 [Trichonephila clavipes]
MYIPILTGWYKSDIIRFRIRIDYNLLFRINELHLLNADSKYRIPVLWLATLTAMPYGLGSNPEEDMDVCKRIVPLRHGGTLNSRRAASPLVWLVGSP